MTSELSARYAKGMSFLARPGSGLRSLVLLHGIGSNAQSFSHLTCELPDELGREVSILIYQAGKHV